MEIQTTRFGRMEVNEERIITFPRGLLGFPSHTRYALIQTGEENYFFWLQSVDEASLAFVVTDPTIFFKDYQVPLKDETQQELELSDNGYAQIFTICNKVGDWLTGNLQKRGWSVTRARKTGMFGSSDSIASRPFAS